MSLVSLWPPATLNLTSFKWKNRILLLFAPTPGDQRLKEQTSLIDESASGFEDRDFRVFSVAAASQPDDALRNHFHVAKGDYVVVVIGKDGTEKFRHTSVVQPDKIFRLVDSMPMRQAGGR